MKTIAVLCFVLPLVSVGCKILPQNLRSSTENAQVFNLLEEGSIQFVRTSNGTGGELNFRLKDRHSCRVEYWADDPTGRPSPTAPMAVDCPEPADAKAFAIKMPIENITTGIPLTFRIYVWPRTLNFLANLSIEYKEFRDATKIQTGHIIVSRYIGPRNSDEIYTYQFPKTISLAEIKSTIQSKSALGAGSCSDKDVDEELPFPRINSQEDKQNRPLHGLGTVTTDGYGKAGAVVHEFFKTRLSIFYPNIDRQQNWKWNFQWEGQKYEFETYPPGLMASVDFVSGSVQAPVQNRSLGNALEVLDVSNQALTLKPSLLYLPEIGSYRLTIKTADAAKTVLRCVFTADQRDLTIPASTLEKIGAGEYIVTLVLETNQIHFKEGAAYPPWLMTAQDWVHFKINKKM